MLERTRQYISDMKKLSWACRATAEQLERNISNTEHKELRNTHIKQISSRNIRIHYEDTDVWVRLLRVFVKWNHKNTLDCY